MITTIDQNGTKMVAVVLGDSWSVDIENYRKALFEVFEYALLNQEMFPTAQIGGIELYTYTKLLRAFTDKVNVEDEEKAEDTPDEQRGEE